MELKMNNSKIFALGFFGCGLFLCVFGLGIYFFTDATLLLIGGLGLLVVCFCIGKLAVAIFGGGYSGKTRNEILESVENYERIERIISNVADEYVQKHFYRNSIADNVKLVYGSHIETMICFDVLNADDEYIQSVSLPIACLWNKELLEINP